MVEQLAPSSCKLMKPHKKIKNKQTTKKPEENVRNNFVIILYTNQRFIITKEMLNQENPKKSSHVLICSCYSLPGAVAVLNQGSHVPRMGLWFQVPE